MVFLALLFPTSDYEAPGLGIRSFDLWANRSFYVKKWANERFTQKKEQLTHSLIFGERNERFPHIAHFLWATWANRSWSLIFIEPNEQFAHIAHLIWAKAKMSDSLTSHTKKRKWAIRSFFRFFYKKTLCKT